MCEEHGCFEGADPSKVSDRAKKRGLVQLGSLGSGNHYTEIQAGWGQGPLACHSRWSGQSRTAGAEASGCLRLPQPCPSLPAAPAVPTAGGGRDL